METENKRLQTELKLRDQGDDIGDGLAKYWRKYSPRPRPLDAALMLARFNCFDADSVARAIPTGIPHAVLEGEVDPRLQDPARSESLIVGGGGDAAAGFGGIDIIT